MTSAALSWGCAFLAFAPFLSLLFVLCYHKAQLVIVVTTSAFFFLLSSLGASFLYFCLNAITFGWTGDDMALAILIPGVLCQFVGRCVFGKLYHAVERVILVSIRRHEQQQQQQQQEQQQQQQQQHPHHAVQDQVWKLRLELNDWACGLAAGTGFGGMHAVLLYGTLLASESNNTSGGDGTLYQPSCPGMPSLVLSALTTCLFSLMDVVWMLFTFYGMRQRALGTAAFQHHHVDDNNNNNDNNNTFPSYEPSMTTTTTAAVSLQRPWGAWVSRTKRGGTLALWWVLVSHMVAALVTTLNAMDHGCVVSLPLLTLLTGAVGVAFWGGLSKVYLPANQRLRGSSS